MKNKKGNIYIYLIFIILCIILSIIVYFAVKNNSDKSNNQENTTYEDDVVESSIKPFDSTKRMNVTIDGKQYEMVLENNLAALDLMSISPLEIDMEDLNNNEKYYYLSYSLSDSDVYTGKVNSGDVMLYQTNCIVIFYEDVDSDYSYIKLGHINGLDELNNGQVKVLFE